MGASEGGQDIVYYIGVEIAGSGGNSVGYNLHWNNTGDDGTVGDALDDI